MNGVTLHLYDSLTRTLRPFNPLKPGVATVYLCGATVQSVPHIGHIRSAVSFDILRRWLITTGYDVLFVRNVTDIDDKILHKAADARRPWWEWASRHEQEFSQAYASLGVMPPSSEPHATGYIPHIIAYITRLIAAGKAYANEGDVYFNVSSQADYGQLSRQKLDEVQQGEDNTRGKRDQRDFTLWKGAKAGEPAWDSPWGPGRPGWHIECSAMATSLLGPEFDIHAGGIDLTFPHHENEIAQAHGAGDGFAQYWLHNGWITLSGEKMSKSLGNVVNIPHLLEHVRGIELRYYLSTTHYRSHQEYSLQALLEAAAAFQKVELFLTEAHKIVGDVPLGAPTDAFVAAMNKDIALPEAIAEIHRVTSLGNSALNTAKRDNDTIGQLASSVRSMLAIIGCDPFDKQWFSFNEKKNLQQSIASLVEAILALRAEARDQKDFAQADSMRTILQDARIAIKDGPSGTCWSLISPNTTECEE